MIDATLKRLKFDKRLLNRRGWVRPEEVEQELAALPDCADKIAPAEEAEAKSPQGA